MDNISHIVVHVACKHVFYQIKQIHPKTILHREDEVDEGVDVGAVDLAVAVYVT